MLTPHELRIAVMTVQGYTNVELAAHFGVVRRTIEFHLTNIYVKLGITRRAQLAGALIRSNLLTAV